MKKAVIIAVVCTVMAGGGLFAQAIPGGFASPQSAATQGRLRSAADDFIRPDSYAGVAFTNWYGMVSYATTNTATLGYAAKLGGGEKPVYLGVFYSGSFWANVQSFNPTERETPWLGATKNVPAYNSLPAFTTTPSNQLAVLVGVADMGFRLSFRTTYQSFKEDEFAVSLYSSGLYFDYYQSHETEAGMLSPQIAWSMSKNLVTNGIKPWATFDFGINRNYTKTAQYLNNGNNDWVAQGMIVNSQNNIAPEFNVGLGGYTFANKNGWRTSADIEYRLQITAYDNNEYNYIDSNGIYQTATFKGTFDGGEIIERSFNGHRVRPIISTQWNGEKLRLRAKLDFNLLFNTTEANPMAVRLDSSNVALPSGELGYVDDTAKAFQFQFNPDLNLAAQWQVSPRFFLNIGGRLNVQALSATTTEGKRYINGEAADKGDYKTTAMSYGATQNQLNLGVTINATDNLGIEAVTGLSGTTKGTNSVNVFDTGNTGLFNFGSILVALKF